jgi:Zn-dependent protease
MFLQVTPVDPGLNIGALLIGLAVAIIFHEVAHGWVALKLGDPTAKYAGRLTLNPIKHIDMWGTIIVPLVLLVFNSISGGGFLFGWAKPVPVNYYNLKNGRYGPAIVALAGPATNLILLTIASFLARLSPVGTSLPYLFGVIALVNGWLMMFNLLPIPPLDGSKVLYILLEKRPDIIQMLEKNGIIILLMFIMFGGPIFRLISIPALLLVNVLAGPEVLSLVLYNL